MIFANFHYVIFVNFHYFFYNKKIDFSNSQPFVSSNCPCDIYYDSQDKQISLYLDKEIYGKLLYVTLNQKELGKLLHYFCNENKKNVVFVTNTIIALIPKN